MHYDIPVAILSELIMIVFFDDEDLLPIEEQVNCLESCEAEYRARRCETVRKSLNTRFMAERVSTLKYMELSRKLKKLSCA